LCVVRKRHDSGKIEEFSGRVCRKATDAGAKSGWGHLPNTIAQFGGLHRFAFLGVLLRVQLTGALNPV